MNYMLLHAMCSVVRMKYSLERALLRHITTVIGLYVTTFQPLTVLSYELSLSPCLTDD